MSLETASQLLIGVSSVIAKDFRDSLMKKLQKIPECGFEDHFGYPTCYKMPFKKYGTIALHQVISGVAHSLEALFVGYFLLQ